MISSRGRDGLVTKIFRIIAKDRIGLYVPYCLYQRHPGVSVNYRVCEKRNCSHYARLYLPEDRPENGGCKY